MIFSHMTGMSDQYVKIQISNYHLILHGKIKSVMLASVGPSVDVLEYLDDFDPSQVITEYLILEFQGRRRDASEVMMRLITCTKKYQYSRIFVQPLHTGDNLKFMLPVWSDSQRFRDWISSGGYCGMSEADRLLLYIENPMSKPIIERMMAIEQKIRDNQTR